jgi:hypothetical protein
MLLIFATDYDVVTRRTHAIARRLLETVADAEVETVSLFGEAAVAARFRNALADEPSVIAFYGHGDEQGRILTQDRKPCWLHDGIPKLTGVAVYAHACRAMCWLSEQAAYHHARLLVGYRIDLCTPADGSERFWQIYQEIHSFVPGQLARSGQEERIRRDYYDLCTVRFHELNATEANLMEIIAVQQSRDYLAFLEGHA